MKILNNKIGSIVQFYKKTKKRLFRKMLIVATCVVCVFAPIFDSYSEVEALTGVEEAMVISGVLSILALGGIKIADDIDPSNLYNACSDVVDGFTKFGSQLSDNVQRNFNNLIDTVVSTGTVALGLFNSLTGELYNCFNNLFGNSPYNPNFKPIVASGLIGGWTFHQISNDVVLEKVFPNSAWAEQSRWRNEFLAGTRSGYCYFNASGKYIGSQHKPSTYTWWFNSSGSLIGSTSGPNTFSFNPDYTYYIFGPFKMAYDGITGVYDSLTNMWVDATTGLELGLDWAHSGGQTYPLDLHDNSYINYGDINDMTLPRYTGKDATMNPDGTITDAGTYTLPNYYIPNLEKPFPPVLPFPLPEVGTIPKDWTGDITKDTPIEDTGDTDITDPDYKVPVVGDFLGDYDVPGKLQWKEYFPFCIPFDLIKFLGILSAEPETPHIKWDYDLSGVKGTLDLDLKKFDGVASVCRTMFNLLFVVGLTFATRDIIKG